MADGHAGHDLEAIVAFADGELSGSELETAAAQVAACTSCAQLVEDLRLLAAADRALATPPRPRDFRLTPADAERLRSAAAEPVRSTAAEPVALRTRLGTEMTTDPHAHRTHDPELIAAAADGTLTGPDAGRAEAWLATCAACAELRNDLVAIAAASRTLATPARTRDFQLSRADAERLRGSGWRGILARIGTSRDAFSRPLAVGLTTLGLAGLLLAGGSSLLSGAGSNARTLSTVGEAIPNHPGADDTSQVLASGDDHGVFSGEGEAAAPSAAASVAPSAAALAPAPSASKAAASAAPAPAASAAPALPDQAGPIEATDGGRTSDAATSPTAGGAAAAAAPSTDGSSPLLETADLDTGGSPGLAWSIVLPAAMLLVGLVLFAIRWVARRSRET